MTPFRHNMVNLLQRRLTCTHTFSPIINYGLSMLQQETYGTHLRKLLKQGAHSKGNLLSFCHDMSMADYNKSSDVSSSWVLSICESGGPQTKPPKILFCTLTFVCMLHMIRIVSLASEHIVGRSNKAKKGAASVHAQS